MDEFVFDKSTLNSDKRKDGVAAFMRIKNGEDFLEETIESHIEFFDEIIACYNCCSDSTESILLRLQVKYPEKLKVYHYLPEVFPPGSDLHKVTAANSVNSLVNYYNFALSKTTYKIVTKLDDDHIAIGKNLKKAMDYIRADYNREELMVFSGLNLLKEKDYVGVYNNAYFGGVGDHWFFRVTSETYFIHDLRYEVLQHPFEKVKYVGLLYFHLKFLKPNYGFGNYNFQENPNSRYKDIFEDFLSNKEFVSVDGFLKKAKKPSNFVSNFYSKLFKKIKYKLKFKYKETFELDRALSLYLDLKNGLKELKEIQEKS